MYDQPAGEWLGRNYAARVWQLLEKCKNEFPKDLDESDLELLDEVQEIEEQLQQERETPEGKARAERQRLEKQIEAQRKVDRQKARNRA